MGYTKTAKPEATWSKTAKAAATWLLLPLVYYLLREQGDYLLTEAGFKIVIGGDHPVVDWTKVAKPAIP